MDLIQKIGTLANDVACERADKLLVYAEVQDGVISADVLFHQGGSNVVEFRFAPDQLQEVIYEYWETGDHRVEPRSWTTMQYVVNGDKFDVHFLYPKQLKAGEDLSDRRPRVIAGTFPGLKVNYSRPKG